MICLQSENFGDIIAIFGDRMHLLTHMAIQNAGAGKLNDGGGLYVYKTNKASGRFVYRYQFNKKRVEMGLGSVQELSLADARRQRDRWEEILITGENPIDARERLKIEEQARIAREQAAKMRDAVQTVEAVSRSCFESIKHTMKNEGRNARWLSSLELHIFPTIGSLPIVTLDQFILKAMLEDIWMDKPVIAQKALTRLGIVLRHATALGLNVDDNIAKKAKLLLGHQPNKPKSLAMMPYDQVPQFYATLGENLSELALRLVILTACRSGEIRGLRWDEINTNHIAIPSERMKAKKDHLIPLTYEMRKIIELSEQVSQSKTWVFATRAQSHITDVSLNKRLKGYEATVHGMRSSFSTWANEQTNYDRSLIEASLAHTVGGQVENTYRRTSWLNKRHLLMNAWNDFVLGKQPTVIEVESFSA